MALRQALLPDSWEKILFLVLGWLLGLLAPAIVDAIRRRRENSELKRAIFAELHQLQYKISAIAYLLRIQTDQYDRPFLLWQKRIVESYQGPRSTGPLPASINETLKLTDEQITLVGQRLKSPPGASLGLKSLDAPLLTSKISLLGAYPVRTQNLLLEVNSRIRLVNEEVEQYRFYYRQTFTAADHQHEVLRQNIDKSYRTIATQVEKISSHIDEAVAEQAKEDAWRPWHVLKRNSP